VPPEIINLGVLKRFLEPLPRGLQRLSVPIPEDCGAIARILLGCHLGSESRVIEGYVALLPILRLGDLQNPSFKVNINPPADMTVTPHSSLK
jgi:hypothetical protein